jgi:hypothetical protein
MKRANLIVLIVCLTSACTRPASTLDPQPTPTDGVRLCTVADLQTSSNSNDAGGSTVLGVTLVNTSKSPCILAGPPPVTLAGDGRVLDVEIAQDSAQEEIPSTPAALRIAPGESVIAILIWENYCGAAPTDNLTIHLDLTIDETLEIPAKEVITPRCEAKNRPSTLTIYPYSYPP